MKNSYFIWDLKPFTPSREDVVPVYLGRRGRSQASYNPLRLPKAPRPTHKIWSADDIQVEKMRKEEDSWLPENRLKEYLRVRDDADVGLPIKKRWDVRDPAPELDCIPSWQVCAQRQLSRLKPPYPGFEQGVLRAVPPQPSGISRHLIHRLRPPAPYKPRPYDPDPTIDRGIWHARKPGDGFSDDEYESDGDSNKSPLPPDVLARAQARIRKAWKLPPDYVFDQPAPARKPRPRASSVNAVPTDAEDIRRAMQASNVYAPLKVFVFPAADRSPASSEANSSQPSLSSSLVLTRDTTPNNSPTTSQRAPAFEATPSATDAVDVVPSFRHEPAPEFAAPATEQPMPAQVRTQLDALRASLADMAEDIARTQGQVSGSKLSQQRTKSEIFELRAIFAGVEQRLADHELHARAEADTKEKMGRALAELKDRVAGSVRTQSAADTKLVGLVEGDAHMRRTLTALQADLAAALTRADAAQQAIDALAAHQAARQPRPDTSRLDDLRLLKNVPSQLREVAKGSPLRFFKDEAGGRVAVTALPIACIKAIAATLLKLLDCSLAVITYCFASGVFGWFSFTMSMVTLYLKA